MAENRVDVEFGAKTGELDDAFSKIKAGAKSVGEQVKDGFDPAAAASTALGFSIANLATEIASKLIAAVREAIFAFSALGDEVEHMQHRLGGSAESLSALKVALDSVGISVSTYEAIAGRLPMVLEKNAEKFKAAGIAYTDAHNNLLPTSQVILNITAHLEKFTAGAARNAEGMALMGRSYTMFADMVELTAERQAEATAVARQFGLTLSEDDVQAADDFGRQTALLTSALHGFFVEIGSALTPSLTELAVVLRNTLGPAFDLLALVLKPIAILLDGIAMSIVLVAAVLLSLVAVIELAIKGVNALGWVMAGQFTKGADLAREAVEDYKKTVADLGNMTLSAADTLNAHMGRVINGEKAETKDPDTQAQTKISPEQQALAKARIEAELLIQREGGIEWLALMQEQYDNGLISTKQFYAAKLKADTDGIDAAMKAKRKELEDSKTAEAGDKYGAPQYQAEQVAISAQLTVMEMQRSEAVRKNTREYSNAEAQRASAMQKLLAQEKLNSEQAGVKGDQTAAQQKLALRKITEDQIFVLQRAAEDRSLAATKTYLRAKLEADLLVTKDKARTMKEHSIAMESEELKHQQKLTEIDNAAVREREKYSLQVQQSVQSSMSSMFEEMMKGTKSLADIFKSFANSVIADIQRIVAQKMAEQLMGAGSSGGGGSFLGNAISGLFGAATGSKSGGASTGGADLTKTGGGGASTGYKSMIPGFAVGTNYVPNDMLAMVHKGERIVPAAQNNPGGLGAGQNVTVHNTFTVAGNVDTRTQSQIATLAGLSMQRAMARNA